MIPRYTPPDFAELWSAKTRYDAWLEVELAACDALERHGRFLFAQKDANGADAAFSEALRLSAGHPSEAAVSAQAGLAAIAASRGDAQTALEVR